MQPVCLGEQFSHASLLDDASSRLLGAVDQLEVEMPTLLWLVSFLGLKEEEAVFPVPETPGSKGS